MALTPEQAFHLLPRAPAAVRESQSLACSLFAYKDRRVSRLVWSIKNHRSTHGAAVGAYALSRTLWSYGPIAVIVPLPITRQRRRERGFNQCELIMEAMRKMRADSARHACGLGSQIIFEKDLLRRIHDHSQQKKKDRHGRLEGVQGIFQVNEKVAKKYSGREFAFIIIDDVITTGSTMKEAVETMRAAGFTRVHGVSVAH